MPDIRDLLEGEARLVEPSDDWIEQTLIRVRPRRRTATAIMALTVAAAGFLLVVRAFTFEAPRGPTSGGSPNYEITARLLPPDEPVEGTAARSEDFAWIHVDVRWDPAEEPGVHRCTWEVLDAQGDVVSSRTMFYVPHVVGSKGHAAFTLKMLDLTGEPAAARAECQPERLDTPGIAVVDPWPELGNWDSLQAQLERRVEEWGEEFEIHEMDPGKLAGNLVAIRNQTLFRFSEDEFLPLQERYARIHALCILLPQEHEFRGGEFCD